MIKKDKDFEQEYDSLKDVTEFQNNMFNPGHYIGTGKVPPTVSAPGNALPLAILCFLMAVGFAIFGLFLFFGDVNVTCGGLIESPETNKIIALIMMLAISAGLAILGRAYLKKSQKYYRAKSVLEVEKVEEEVEDKIWQRTCPECGQTHDIDYPKCPNCKYNYPE